MAGKGQSCGSSESASIGTVFVANGDPVCIRPVGIRWTFAEDYVGFKNGPRSILLGGREIGSGDFHLTAKLAVVHEDVVPAMVAGARGIEGFQARRISYAARPVRRLRHLAMSSDRFTSNRAFRFEAIRQGDRLTFLIDGRAFHAVTYAGESFGPVGFTVFPEEGRYPPDLSFKIYDFSVRGATRPFQGWSLSRSWRSSLPEVDISDDEERKVVIARGTHTIGESYPSTVLMPDGKTIFCVYETYELNPDWKPGAKFPAYTSRCGPLKKSLDGGRTWSGLLPTHESWETVRNCPTIHRLEDPGGQERLLVMVPYGPEPGMHQSVSLDGGATWSKMRPNGLSCTVPPIRLAPLSGGRYLAAYHDSERNGPICGSITEDGGLTWAEQVVAVRHPDAFPCEPFITPSPDGKELTMIAREQSRIYNSILATSRDEGRTWIDLREGPTGLTGDRHIGLYAPDGRLIVVFRDNSVNTPAAPLAKISNFVAWVGAYEDLVEGGEGECRIILLQGSAAYPGLVLLADGTIVATCAMKNYPGDGRMSVMSTRFKMEEIDALLAESQGRR